MKSNWENVPLERLVAPGRGISYGIVQPGHHIPDGIPIVRVSDVRDGRIATASPLRVSPSVEASYSRTRLEGGELLVTIVGTVGENAIAPAGLAGWNTARAIAVVPIADDVGAYWVSAMLRTPAARDFIRAHLNTTVQATLNLRDLANVPIPLPPRPEREAIEKVLRPLDAKIELNREINATLEAIARALFKSWFVNFDPVYANAEHRELELAAPIASLFPRSFNEQQLPQTWRIISIYDVADVIYGAPFASRFFNRERIGKPVIRIRDLRSQAPEIYTTEVHPKGYVVQPGDLLVGMDGEFRPYMWVGPEGWMNQRVCCFKPKPGVSRAYVHFAIESLLSDVERSETATTVIHLGKADIDTFTVVSPGAQLMRCYADVADKIEAHALATSQELRTLIALRDSLLPKLISGDLHFREAS